jgi:hypothetical protein
MVTTTLDLLNAANGTHPVGERIAVWCGQYQAKELARMFDVAPRTAEGWRAGRLPQMRHLIAMAEQWGISFLEDTFEPVLNETDTSLDYRLERIERDIHALRTTTNDEENRGNSSTSAHLGRGQTHKPRLFLAQSLKSTGMILATIAVMGSLFTDSEFVRTPRPTQSRPQVSRTREAI